MLPETAEQKEIWRKTAINRQRRQSEEANGSRVQQAHESQGTNLYNGFPSPHQTQEESQVRLRVGRKEAIRRHSRERKHGHRQQRRPLLLTRNSSLLQAVP